MYNNIVQEHYRPRVKQAHNEICVHRSAEISANFHRIAMLIIHKERLPPTTLSFIKYCDNFDYGFSYFTKCANDSLLFFAWWNWGSIWPIRTGNCVDFPSGTWEKEKKVLLFLIFILRTVIILRENTLRWHFASRVAK